MPTKKQASVNFTAPPVPTRNGMPALSGEVLTTPGRKLKEQQQFISDQVRIDQMIEAAIALKVDYAQYLSHHISTNTDQRYDDFLNTQRSLLDKDRQPQEQADLEAFCKVTRQSQGEALLALRNAGINAMAQIAMRPIDRPRDEPDEVIIEPARSVWGRVRGELQVTKVRR